MLTMRRARHERVSAALASLGDDALAAALDSSPTGSVGVGGGVSVIEVDGIGVLAKRVPITERELASPHSTANLFDLPLTCQYGMHPLAGPSFGAWRELEANLIVTDGVLGGECEAFALLHHWRVLPGRALVAPEHVDVEAVVEQFEGDAAVRSRLAELAAAPSSLVLFSEHVPGALVDSLGNLTSRPETVERQIFDAVSFLRRREILHMDGHFGNMRFDGEQVYLVDFGLATSPRFDLSDEERDFVAQNIDHDADYAAMRLVNWVVTSMCTVPGLEVGGLAVRNAYVRRCAEGDIPSDVPSAAVGILVRHAAAAARMNDFCWRLVDGDVRARYRG